MNNKREFERLKSLNLVSYVFFNIEGEIISNGMGRTLNISDGGILLEIDEFVEDEINMVKMEIALDDNIINIDGEVRFCKKNALGHTECGIQFYRTDMASANLLHSFVKSNLGMKIRNPRLLRSENARIESLGLTLANEHRILSEHIDAYKIMAEEKESQLTTPNIMKLMLTFNKDLSEHFYFEENVVFKTALEAKKSIEILELVNRFKKDHIIIMQELNDIIAYLKLIKAEGSNPDEFITRKIFLLMGKAKKHDREEQELLVPLIENEKEIIMHMNELLSIPEK